MEPDLEKIKKSSNKKPRSKKGKPVPEKLPEKKAGEALGEDKLISLVKQKEQRKRAHTKKKDKQPGKSRAGKKKKASVTDLSLERDLRAARADLDFLLDDALEELTGLYFSFKANRPSEEIFNIRLREKYRELVDSYREIIKGLKSRDVDSLESAYGRMMENMQEMERLKILLAPNAVSPECLEKIRLAVLDMIDGKPGRDETASFLIKLREYVEDMGRINREEFGSIENPGEDIRETNERFNALLDEYRQGINIIDQFLKQEPDNSAGMEILADGLLVLKRAEDGIEDMLKGQDSI